MTVQDAGARVGAVWGIEGAYGADGILLAGLDEQVHQFLQGFARGGEDELLATDAVHLEGLTGDVDVAHFVQIDDEAFAYAHKGVVGASQLFAQDAFYLAQLVGDEVFVAVGEAHVAVVAIGFDADDLGGGEAVGFVGGVDEEHDES